MTQAYSRLASEFYDLDRPDAPADALDFYARYAQSAVGPIFEPMCGSGRFLLPLLARGIPVEGADASAFMLAACRERALAAGLEPVLTLAALHEGPPTARFGLVIIPSGSIGLITEPDLVMSGLQNLYSALLPNGKLVLEIDRPGFEHTCSWPWGARWLQRQDGALLVQNYVGQYAASERVSYNLHRYELVRDARVVETEVEQFNVRYYEGDEFHELLSAAGFRHIRRFKPFEDCEPDAEDEGMVFEATKAVS